VLPRGWDQQAAHPPLFFILSWFAYPLKTGLSVLILFGPAYI
jgi:hypothetical protein